MNPSSPANTLVTSCWGIPELLFEPKNILLLQLPMGQARWPVLLEVPPLLGVLALGILGANVLVPGAALGLGLVLGAPVLVVLRLRLVFPAVPGSLDRGKYMSRQLNFQSP